MIEPSNKVKKFPKYVFAVMNELKFAKMEQGVDVIDMVIGSPDLRPSQHIIDYLHKALDDKNNQYHRYSPFEGIPVFRNAVAAWYKKRFEVNLDPKTEVIPLTGSKTGLLDFFMAYTNIGDRVLMPSPAYPAYFGCARVAELNYYEMGLKPENDFLVDLSEIPTDVAKEAKIIVINYPNNPTGGIETRKFYEEVLRFGKEYDLLIASDIAYSELSMDDNYTPSSFLQLPGAKDYSVEFSSFSKSYSMAGWRVGALVGNREVVGNVLKLKANIDFSVFMAVQKAAAETLLGPQDCCVELAHTYRRRRDVIVNGLRELGWNVPLPKAAMYVWAPIPPGFETSMDFAKFLLDKTGIAIAPGDGFGTYGKGFFRISLVVPEERMAEAVQRIKNAGLKY